MANEVTVTALDVRPLPGAVCRNAIAAGVLNLGDIVAMTSTANTVDQADGNGNHAVVGIVVAIGNQGASASVAGDAVSVCLSGPVQGYSGMTPGNLHYLSDTIGRLSTAVGTAKVLIGIAWAADILLVHIEHEPLT
jgi:hypothetical protein